MAPAPSTATRRPASPPRWLAGELDRGLAERSGPPTDGGVGAHLLADLDRAAEQQVERRGDARPPQRASSQASRTWPRISCSPSTAESSPAATLNRCVDGVGVVGEGQVRGDLVGVQLGAVGQRVAGDPVGVVEAPGVEVDLDPVAGRQHDRAVDGIVRAQLAQELRPLGGPHADLFQYGEGGGAMGEAEGYERHGSVISAVRPRDRGDGSDR